jgi:ribulose-5-phosphate 4-epimerase/fuculose-1-phosphate aldolase
MTAERLVKVDFGGVAVGSGKPSKEVAFHLHAYSVRSDVSAVLHLHSPYSVCLSCMLAKEPFPIPAMTPGYAIRVGRLPMIPLMIPGSAQLAAAVREVIAVGDCVLLAKHGVVVVGKDLEGALNIAEEIEENAKIFVLGGARAAGLTDEEVASVRKAFALKVY